MIAPLYWSLVAILLLVSIVLISMLADNAFNQRRTPWIPYPLRVLFTVTFYLMIATVFILLLAVDPT